MSFPSKRDPGTGTKNEIITDWRLSPMRIQINKNPSMTARQLHNKCVRLQTLSIGTIQICVIVLLHKKHRFPLFGAYCNFKLLCFFMKVLYEYWVPEKSAKFQQ